MHKYSSFRKAAILPHWIVALMMTAAILPAAAETVTDVEPDAFLEWVETPQDSSNDDTVTQYIDTGVKAETGLKARMDAVVLSNTRNDSAILGARYNNNRRFLMLHSYGKNAWTAYGLNNSGKWTDSVQHPVGTRYEQLVDFSDGAAVQVYVNGLPRLSAAQQATLKSVAEDPATGSISASWMGNLSLYLFAANNGGTAAWPCRIRLYELKILKKNATTGKFDILRHYLPCIKDGRAGLYDKEHNTIYYSDGSADLVAGPVLDKPLDFVESIAGTGKQYFDTRVWGKSGLKSEVEVSTGLPSYDRAFLASRGNDGTTANDTRLFMAYHYESAFRFAHGKLPSKKNINVVVPTNNVLSATHNDVRYLIKTDTTLGHFSMTVSRNGGEPVEVLKDGVDYGSDYLATTNTLFILTNNLGGKPTNINEGTIYGVKIWDGDELLRDFVPVVATNSAGAAYAGLYDQATKRIYRQSSSTDFDLSTYQVGAVTNTLRTVAEPQTRLEYVESDGNWDFIDLGVMAKDGVETDLVMDWQTVVAERAVIGARNFRASDGVVLARFAPYTSYDSSHALAYATSRYTARNAANEAVDVEQGVKTKVSTRLDAGEQSISVKMFKDNAWTTPATRSVALAGPVDVHQTMYLFAYNEDGQYRFPVKVRCYGLKLKEKQNGEYKLVRDFVPVRDPVTGGAALWDKVSGKYFRNGGKYRLAGGGKESPLNQGLLIIVR
ncbi:MAG: hypothetical protein J6P13_08010 [Kiritimatiellae bacterium]|nr:hypothetical protein [Kiritimatiellia bacterium]